MAWKYIAARATGRSHLIVGQDCQDRFACSTSVKGWFVVAVADGAGSATFSDIGAEVAANTAVAELEASLTHGEEPTEAIRLAVERARSAVIQTAENAGSTPREYASTLLVAALGPSGGSAAQIGDGLIAVRDSDEDWAWVFWPHRGEYANVTRFLIEDDALEALEVTALRKEVRDIALMTDGLEPLALHYETRTAHSPFFEGIAPHLRASPQGLLVSKLSAQLEDFLASPRIAERVDDDVTLVLATRA